MNNNNPVFPNVQIAHQQAGQGAFAQGNGPVANRTVANIQLAHQQAGQGAFTQHVPVASSVAQRNSVLGYRIPRGIPIHRGIPIAATIPDEDDPGPDGNIIMAQPVVDGGPRYFYSPNITRRIDNISTRASTVRRVASRHVSTTTSGIRSRYDRNRAEREINSLVRADSIEEAWELLNTHLDNGVFTQAQFNQINDRIERADDQLFEQENQDRLTGLNTRLQNARLLSSEMAMERIDAERELFEEQRQNYYNERGREGAELLLERAENLYRDRRPR
jgi:hypothetical protein